MPDRQLKPGDVVELRSGSPLMTVSSVSSDTKLVHCVWFDPTERTRQSASFGYETLRLSKSPTIIKD